MTMNLKDLHSVADRQANAEERRRKAKADQLNSDIEKRHQAAVAAEEEQRTATMATLKEEVRSHYKASNLWATDSDFERAWKADAERLIREYNAVLASVGRM